MDIRVLALLLVCVTVAVCKHTGHNNHKHQRERDDLARELLELRGKHNGNNKHKHNKHHDKNTLKRLLEKASESDAEIKERSAYETGDEDERSEDERSEGESERSHEDSERSEGENEGGEDESERGDDEDESSDEDDKRSETDEIELLSALADRFF